MQAALAELPLAVFSTFAPMGAGAFVFLAMALFMTDFDENELKRIDRAVLIPLGVVAVGMVATFFHVASPLHSVYVLMGIGSSPLSNEIAAAIVFFGAAALYWLLAVLGKLGVAARRRFAAVVAVLGVVFSAFVGLAYNMETISTWSSPTVPAQIVCFALVGGAGVACLTLAAAGALSKAAQTRFRPAAVAVCLAAAVAGVALFAAYLAGAAAAETAVVSGAEVVSGLLLWAVCAAVLLVAAGVLAVPTLRCAHGARMAGVMCAVALCGIFLARLAFYATEISVGLTL